MDTDLLFEYGHPSIQTLVAWSLDNEVPNCKSQFLLLVFFSELKAKIELKGTI